MVKFIVLLGAVILIASAQADTFFISVDEWGKGYVCDASGGSAAIPLCAVDPTTHLGSFARLASGFTDDPTSGATHVLTYNLPFDYGVFDVAMTDISEGLGFFDLLRFKGNQLLFYSLQGFPQTGDCSTMNPPAMGCDGLADVHTLPVPIPDNTTIPELGPEGDNNGLFITGNPGTRLTEFIFQSDELTACPPLVPNCTALNVAPPPGNPFRDITGLNASVGIVMLPVGNNFNPNDVMTPEPASIWLLVAGAAILAFICRRSTSPSA